ncbi:site-specific DNA-methyltransferase [Moritella viscosa]|uniref:site-specific DNA-methyltransferase (adenine-specific) n=1 Tax=Moritella viscosa TaxID=80854 RepID=A0A1K9ZHP3_9GAMM|nr:site-specific DNA-methyltransferase [Moritella viscosa]SGY94823.1 Site-specific DNA-methyltransferase (Adenine-specific) [Moritella viscosa]
MSDIEKITGSSPEAKSLDITQQNIEQLKQLFPDVFSENKIDFEALKAVLGEEIDDSEERYNFTWNGKTKARQIAQTPSTGTLRPCKEESVNWDTTENLFIEGDNLEVLKLLQKSYHKKVKMIYIDPPYNTGKDFVYKDNFHNNIQNYFQTTGQVDGEGNVVSTNSDTSGRYHSNWLNMIYPRIKLARNLITDDGVIFLSINDSEVDNLKKVCNELFGEENFIAQIIWQKSKRGDSKLIATIHEYILVYTKNKPAALESGIWRKKKNGVDDVLEQYAKFKSELNNEHSAIRIAMQKWYRSLKDSDPRKAHKHYTWSDDRGLYFPDNFAGPDDGRKNRPRHDILHPATQKVCKKPSTGWRWEQTKTDWALEQTPPRIHFGEDETTIPNRKSYLAETAFEPYSSVFYTDGRGATLEVEALVGKSVFQFPKNKEVISDLIGLVCKKGDIVLDFFAGSGSTAHAVYNHNSLQEDAQVNYVLIQLPEPTDPKSKAYEAGYEYITEITKKRISGASSSFIEAQVSGDFGFKTFSLDETNIRPWDADFDNLEQVLQQATESIKADRSSEDVLYEIFLKYGYDLTTPVETETVNGKQVFVVGAGALIVCLDDEITGETVEGIAKLKEELDPETTQVVFKDAGFADSNVKTNAIQILKQAGIDDVKSI